MNYSPHMPDSVESIYDAVHILFNKAYISPEPSVPEDVPVHLIDETLRLIKDITERDVIRHRPGQLSPSDKDWLQNTVEKILKGAMQHKHDNSLRDKQRQALHQALYGKDK